MKLLSKTFLGSVAAGLLISSSALILPVHADDKDFPEAPTKELFLKVCTQCHDVEAVPHLSYTHAQWQELVFTMKDNGADATSDELDAIIEYLNKSFGKQNKVNVNKASAEELTAALSVTAKEAQALVDYRKQHGDFKTLQDVQKVDGVDAKKIEAAKDKMEF